MSDRIRIADLPTTTNIDLDSYMIVERPEQGEGTFKSTLRDIQEAITVRASVTTDETGLVVIEIKDMTGEYEASFVIPTAKVVDNGDNTSTITIVDTNGTSSITFINSVIVDLEPVEGSNNFVTSGTVWSLHQADRARIAALETELAATKAQLSAFEAEIQSQLDTIDAAIVKSLDVEDGNVE